MFFEGLDMTCCVISLLKKGFNSVLCVSLGEELKERLTRCLDWGLKSYVVLKRRR